MEHVTTKIIKLSFDGVSFTRSFNLSCPFPVKRIESTTTGEPTSAQNVAYRVTSSLVQGEAVGLVTGNNQNTTFFQSKVHQFSFSPVAHDVRGVYTATIDDTPGNQFTGNVYIVFTLKG